MHNQAIGVEPEQAVLTQHAMLVTCGLFAQQMGLVDSLEAVELKQKRREHTAQKKVLEFFVALLGAAPT